MMSARASHPQRMHNVLTVFFAGLSSPADCGRRGRLPLALEEAILVASLLVLGYCVDLEVVKVWE